MIGVVMPENLPPHIAESRDLAARFVEQEIVPRTPAQDDEAGSAESLSAHLYKEVRDASRQAGFFHKTQPVQFGGNPASTLELTVLRELFAAADSPLTSAIFGPGPGVLHAVDGVLKTDYLEPLMRGEKRGAFAFTEPAFTEPAPTEPALTESGSAGRPSWARMEGDSLIVTGQKSYVTGGDKADFVSALLNLENADGSKAGTAMVVIDRQAKGVIVDRAFESMDGSSHVSMRFEQVRVPTSHIIGKPGEGMPRALANIGNVRMMVSAQATGMCLRVLALIEAHLKAPHRSGTPLGEREGVRIRFADMRIETFAARSALYRAARLVDAAQAQAQAAGGASEQVADGAPENASGNKPGREAVNEVMATKVFCTETASRVVDMGVQLVGGTALVRGHPLERLYRQVRALRFVEGASDLLRLNIAKGRLELGKGQV